MRKIIIVLLLISSKSYSQETYNGSIVDKNSKEVLPYVNIGVVGKNIGTVSNNNGDFQIELNEKYDNDTLKISIIGYKSLIFKVSNFKNIILKNPTLQLEEEITELQEVVVSSRKLKEKILGNKTTSKKISGGFSSNHLGNEIGIKIKIKKSPTYIKDFNVFIIKNEYDSIKFRLNFYDLKDGLPNKSLLKDNIIIVSQIKEGKLTVDLSDYDIVVYEDFFVSLEWIENLGDKDGLKFSSGFLGSPIIIRSTSQDDWQKIGAISVGFNVTAKY
ncbi:carboxypeptidase-like regulatory domain-containing protein [Allomuricauda sp. F6463D]|uniref:carboxypeptidase-like regulatory domain-containing protein n=1 Tax=Allomuricauda sp. F6463D TaxID=2926409 RepID=UPI001FF4A00F|nr:carboxypeptidase-like regulatory domain-containing protein [Muricauda sp. F6463D]MCK0159449.1 carboxypeptidase-like regulatory domain-containing protein [Muricauda sp. F6463D]